MGKKQIQKNIKIFTGRVRKRFQPEKIILFGSYAYGKTTDYSDIDMIVVSKKFQSIPKQKRLDVLYELTSDLYPDFHVFGFTPEEFEHANPLTTLYEVKQHGIALL